MSLLERLLQEVSTQAARTATVKDGGPAEEEEEAAAAVAAASAFLRERRAELQLALARFGPDGKLLGGAELPASAYNDFYKWTMLPAMRAVERAPPRLFGAADGAPSEVVCTFCANVRTAAYRRALLDSATGLASPELFQQLRQQLESLTRRRFDRDVFERAVAENSLPGWDSDTLDAVCGPTGQPRSLADEVLVDLDRSTPVTPSSAGHVLVQVFVAHDNKLGETRLHIEASGPWHRVTWLETTLMQAIYETLLRDRMRKGYGSCGGPEEDSLWYPSWLAGALFRCARSAAAASGTGLRGMALTGRRTGGMAFLLLQSMFLQHALRDREGKSLMVGTSSVTARYWLLADGLDPALVPAVAGTHAHEISMVLGALLGSIDDEVGVPLSQAIGHALYFYLSRPQGDVRDPARKMLMPMLPDTLGTRAFMRTAAALRVAHGHHRGEQLVDIFGAARQDSGGLAAFAKLMREFDFRGALMASEIEGRDDLVAAQRLGFALYGAGGFFGDSESAWDSAVKNISMATKVLRVHVGGRRCASDPVKTGDTSDGEGKFEADGLLVPDQLQRLRQRTARLVAADLAVSVERLQLTFEAVLSDILGPGK